MGIERYVRESGDLRFLLRMKPKVMEVLKFLFSRTKPSGFLVHDIQGPETWMDTLERKDHAIEIQSLYYGALKACENLMEWCREKETGKRCSETRERIESNFEVFYKDGYYADRIFRGRPVQIKTPNPLVAILFGLPKYPERILEVVESEMTWEKGVATRGKHEAGFFPSGYHTGSVWSLTTAWACAAEFKASMPEHGWMYFKKLAEDVEKDSLGCIGECWDAFSSKPIGCGLQLWGSGFIPSLIDDYMVGIEIDTMNNRVKVSPLLPKEITWVERTRIFQGKPLRILIKRKNHRTVVKVDRNIPVIKD